jgi:hypothetical protein
MARYLMGPELILDEPIGNSMTLKFLQQNAMKRAPHL